MSTWRRHLRIIASLYLLLAFEARTASAQAGPILLKVGKWLGEQAVGYLTGRTFDKLLGIDFESQLKKVEAGLLSQIQRRSGNETSLRAELDATRSQLGMLQTFIHSQPTAQQVEEFRVRITRDLAKVVQTQADQGKRIKMLEGSRDDHEARIKRLEESQKQRDISAAEVPQSPEPPPSPEPPRWHHRTPRSTEGDKLFASPWRSSPARETNKNGVTLLVTVTGSFNKIVIEETDDFRHADIGAFELDGRDRRYALNLLLGTGGVVAIQGDSNSVFLAKQLCGRVRVLPSGGRNNETLGCK